MSHDVHCQCCTLACCLWLIDILHKSIEYKWARDFCRHVGHQYSLLLCHFFCKLGACCAGRCGSTSFNTSATIYSHKKLERCCKHACVYPIAFHRCHQRGLQDAELCACRANKCCTISEHCNPTNICFHHSDCCVQSSCIDRSFLQCVWCVGTRHSAISKAP